MYFTNQIFALYDIRILKMFSNPNIFNSKKFVGDKQNSQNEIRRNFRFNELCGRVSGLTTDISPAPTKCILSSTVATCNGRRRE